ncbi:alpha/beta fold hydrolase [Saccharopolyspora erythraea]|uniref:alpha/beta hydrolase family protein n=1 Tax=Saccharopolyspora erythraea TaxID=1836 RepID=UPI001BA74100|nr:alpha/beta fold hydrolase [Saccharopolyspora erythraea]QUH03267.1 alpha/beta fold hydrolase [Saccharopolyspora erythraea]
MSEQPLFEAFGQRALLLTTYGGADFGECLTTGARVGAGSGDDWHREWVATADRVAAWGEESERGKHAVSARSAFFRAATYYRVANMPLFGAPVDPRLRETFDKETEVFLRAARQPVWPDIEPVEIPFGSTTLPGYLVTVDDSGAPRPTIVHTNGYDSTIQEMYFAHAPEALARGYNVLLYDGPGQGRPLIHQGLHMRPDWEAVGRAVVDYALTRREIEPSAIVLSGWSFGGYLAPRAAAFDDRLAALVADPGMWDQREGIVRMLPVDDEAKQRFPDVDPHVLDPMVEWLESPEAPAEMRWKLLQRGLWVHGVPTLFEYMRAMMDFQLSPVAARIRCPTLVTQSENDPLAGAAGMLHDSVGATRKALVRFTAAEGAGGHCEATARRLYHQRVFDWLDEVLSG